jgi:hypothetical protein
VPESLRRCHYAAWDLLVVGTFGYALLTPQVVPGNRLRSKRQARWGLSPAAGARNAGWACGPPVPAAVQLATAPEPASHGRYCLAETARSLRRVLAALGKLDRGRPQPGRVPGSAGFPGACRERAHTGLVLPRRATAGEHGRGRAGPVACLTPALCPALDIQELRGCRPGSVKGLLTRNAGSKEAR